MKTLLAGLAGSPVEHSLSPYIHRRFMREAGLAGNYRLFPVDSNGFGELVRRLASRGYAGINVTVPHKRHAAELCVSLSPEAEQTGAVNTIVYRNGRSHGYNTDVFGFAAMSRSLPAPFMVLGTGGGASAVGIALQNREHRLLKRGEELPPDLPSEGTLVNATPLGWNSEDGFPLTPPPGWCFVDLNYNPGWKWRNRLSREGVRVITGELMLVEQAGCAFALWAGYTPTEGLKKEIAAELEARIHGQDRPDLD